MSKKIMPGPIRVRMKLRTNNLTTMQMIHMIHLQNKKKKNLVPTNFRKCTLLHHMREGDHLVVPQASTS